MCLFARDIAIKIVKIFVKIFVKMKSDFLVDFFCKAKMLDKFSINHS